MNAHESDRYIRRHPLFRDIRREGLRQIASHMSLIEERKGNILYFQGDHARSVYLIRSGLIKLSRITPEGRELTFCIFKENDLFGVASLFLGSPRDTAAEAVTDTVLYQIYRNDFIQICNSFPSLAMEVSSIICGRLIKLEEKFQIAVSRDVSSRIARVLLDLAEAFGVTSEEGLAIDLSLTHLEIASLIGSTRETTCVTLNKFRRNGWISSENKRINLLDIRALKSLCET